MTKNARDFSSGFRESPTAVITGGGSGIGAAAAVELINAGWQVVITGRNQDKLDEVASDTGAHAVAADATNTYDVQQLVQETVDRFGAIDGVVLNAGLSGRADIAEMSDAMWNEQLHANLTSGFKVARATLPHLVESTGNLVAVASSSALSVTPRLPAYNAAKAGLAMLMQTIAVDYGPQNVRANTVCPGWTRTAMGDAAMQQAGEKLGVGIEEAYRISSAFLPARRPATPQEIAQVISWLLSPASSYVTGATIPVDGGMTAFEPTAIGYDPRVSLSLDED